MLKDEEKSASLTRKRQKAGVMEINSHLSKWQKNSLAIDTNDSEKQASFQTLMAKDKRRRIKL